MQNADMFKLINTSLGLRFHLAVIGKIVN